MMDNKGAARAEAARDLYVRCYVYLAWWADENKQVVDSAG